jgi:hypothetical protein
MERLRSRARGPAHGQPHTAGHGLLRVFNIVDHFQAADAQIDALRGFGDGRLVHVLLAFDPHRAGIGDGSFHGAQEAVRKRVERMGRRGLRLHFRAPGAQQKPQQRDGKPRHALHA